MRATWLRVVVATAAAVLLAVPATAQTFDPPEEGYDFVSAGAVARGVTTNLTVRDFLPIEEPASLASVLTEARLDATRSSALAALPDPGDLVLTLPGTAGGLLGIPNMPGYPAVSRADHPFTPTHELSLAPDAGLGALRLRTDAVQDQARARAYVTEFVDTIGLLPGFRIGSVSANSHTRRLDPLSYDAVATTTVSNLTLLGGLVRIPTVTTTVTARVDRGRITATREETSIVGALIAGMAVGIDENGFTAPDGSQALAPVVESLTAPLQAAGITVRLTPGEDTVTDTRGEARSGYLSIAFEILIQGTYPAVLTLSLGQAEATIEASGLPDGAGPADGDEFDDLDPSAGADPFDLGAPADLGPSLGSGPGFGTSGGLPAGPGGPTGTGAGAGSPGGTAVPAAFVEPLDFRDLYRWLALAGLALLVGRRWLVAQSRRATTGRPDLRALWRW